MTDRFDTVEYRAARNISEADYFWKHRLNRKPATLRDFPPKGWAKVKWIANKIFMREVSL